MHLKKASAGFEQSLTTLGKKSGNVSSGVVTVATILPLSSNPRSLGREYSKEERRKEVMQLYGSVKSIEMKLYICVAETPLTFQLVGFGNSPIGHVNYYWSGNSSFFVLCSAFCWCIIVRSFYIFSSQPSTAVSGISTQVCHFYVFVLCSIAPHSCIDCYSVNQIQPYFRYHL